MKSLTISLFIALCAVSCGGRAVSASSASPTDEPAEYTFRVKAVYPHPADRYTQGLQYADGRMWEGTGLRGESAVYSTDLQTGESELFAQSPRSEFGEGIALLDGKLYQLTWTDNKAHVYDLRTRRAIGEFRYTGEGWGLTTDGKKLYMSNGSPVISRLDPATFRREASITVTLRGEPLELLNELEWIDGRIWANVYTSDAIVIIDPSTGVVEGVVDLRGLLPDDDRTADTDVLNGIAYDAAGGRIFVTGKCWNKLFEIEIIEL